jgi:hypothetical protein
MIAGEPPANHALSATACANTHNRRGDLAGLASAATAAKTRIIVGGSGFAALPTLPAPVKRYGTLEELSSVALSS